MGLRQEGMLAANGAARIWQSGAVQGYCRLCVDAVEAASWVGFSEPRDGIGSGFQH